MAIVLPRFSCFRTKNNNPVSQADQIPSLLTVTGSKGGQAHWPMNPMKPIFLNQKVAFVLTPLTLKNLVLR